MKISNYTRKYRIDNRYSQEYVADVLGVSQKTYSNMENNRSNIRFETVKKLIKFYKINLATLEITPFTTESRFIKKNGATQNQNLTTNIPDTNISDKLIVQMEEHIIEMKAYSEDLQMRLTSTKP
jgi:transcriptional regulator with XRE-family HTH domain